MKAKPSKGIRYRQRTAYRRHEPLSNTSLKSMVVRKSRFMKKYMLYYDGSEMTRLAYRLLWEKK